jgi:two-component system response regulator AtoC
MRYSWPGNLRELEAFIKRYLVLQDERLMVTELMREIADQARPINVTPETVLNALRQTGGNRRAAAKALDISYKRLLHTLRDFGLENVKSSLW